MNDSYHRALTRRALPLQWSTVRALWWSALVANALACDVFDEQLERRIDGAALSEGGECKTHDDCGGAADDPRVCTPAPQKCVRVTSEDCRLVAGELTPDAIVLGAMFALTGPTEQTNKARLESAGLAIEEINAVGGVPAGETSRKLALVACDAVVDLRRAARHLVNELRVPAMVGPNNSQDAIDVSNEISVRGGTLILSPTAVASSISDLVDSDLTWTMVPTDEQRAPLMRQQINALEQSLRSERASDSIRLSIIYRNDALGLGTRVGLNALMLNNKSLVQNQTATPPTVSLEPYDPKMSNLDELVERQRAFAPDIVVLGGTAEAVDAIVLPLEQRWSGPRPYYVTIDSLRISELLRAVAGNDDLRRRVRGTGILPARRAEPVNDAFRLAYQTEYPGQSATFSGMGTSYDAVHAIAYAIAASEQPPSGERIAKGLRRLNGGTLEVPVQSDKVLAAFRELSAGRAIDALGTFAALRWDDRGAPSGGRVEIWCVSGGAQPAFASSGLTYDLDGMRTMGEYRQCER